MEASVETESPVAGAMCRGSSASYLRRTPFIVLCAFLGLHLCYAQLRISLVEFVRPKPIELELHERCDWSVSSWV
jgi:hypothetical protein